VRSAIGFDQKRGDQVEVVNLRFAETPTSSISEPTGFWSMLAFTKDDIMRAVELGVMLLLGIVVLLMVVRPLVRRIITPDKPIPAGGDPLALPGMAGAGLPALADDTPITAAPSATSKMIDIAQVQGQVHAQSVQKVGELADKNPRETISIIRQWLTETAAA